MADIRKFFRPKKIEYEEEEEEEREKEVEKKKEDDDREPCKYGAGCYQTNPKHLDKYRHPGKREDEVTNNNDRKRPRLSLSKEADQEATSDHSDDGGTEPDSDKAEEENAKKKDGENEDDAEEEDDDDKLLPESPVNPKDNIQQKFLVEMPEDFYSFWEFCEQRNGKARDSLKRLFDLKLVGPYDIMSGKLKNAKQRQLSVYLRHWRYYYDPPEFQTVLAGDAKSQFHIGYFRDDPSEMPAFVASNSASENCKFRNMGPNLFSALNFHINNLLEESKNRKDIKPDQLKKFQSELKDWAVKHKISLEMKPGSIKTREAKVVTKGFHGAGIVVPYDKKTEVGYRPLPDTDANLKKLFQRIENSTTEADRDKHMMALHEIVTLIQFANDECDYGMSLEFGLDMFSFGSSKLHNPIRSVLPLAYQLLNREQYSKIINAHLKDRKKVGGPTVT